MRVVISLTTLPSRLETQTIIPTLKSVNQQTRKPDAVYLGLPKTSRRLGNPYPVPSNEIKQLCTIVTLDKDYGPVCKILGGLYMENDPSTVIITVDDDNIYPENFIEEILKKHQERPKAAIGSSGTVIGKFPGYFAYIRNSPKTRYEAWWGPPVPENGIKVDILCGYSGVLYVRDMFPAINTHAAFYKKNDGKSWEVGLKNFLEIPLSNEDIFLHDDVYLSSYLNSKGIERRLYILPEVIMTEQHANGLSDDSSKFVKSFVRAIKASHDNGLIRNKEYINPLHTIIGRIVFFIILIVVLLIFLRYVFRSLYK